MTSTKKTEQREQASDSPILKIDGVDSREQYNKWMLTNFKEIFGYDFERVHGTYIKTD